MEIARLVLWSVVIHATISGGLEDRDAVESADWILDAAAERFPFLRLPPVDPLDRV